VVLEALLLLCGSLRPRHELQPLVRDRAATLHRDPVGPLLEAPLGALYRGELFLEAVRQALVALRLEDLRPLVGGMLVPVGELLVGLSPEPGERVLDAPALSGEQLACAVRLHSGKRTPVAE
jgi:hypothetical protein